MAFDKVIDSAALDAGMTATANAIRKKTGSNSPIEWDLSNGFKSAVEVIDTDGGVELPELETPASDDDVFLGKEYIDGSGRKQSGSFTIDEELTEQDSLISQIANALKDKAAGSLISLPELTNPADPTDIAYGKVLYDDDGNPVTGTLGDFKPGTEGRYVFGTNPRVSGDTNLYVEAESSSTASPVIHRPGSTATVRIPSAAFGNATADQVAKGATFTSAAGLLVDGTMEAGASGVQMSVDGETLVITGAVTIENETLIL